MTEIHLSVEQQSFIDQQVRAGGYKDATEVVAAGLRLLGSDTEMLRQMIAEADAQFERGEYLTFTTADSLADSVIERGMQQLNRKS